ncbi:alpha-galactosidase [uncultured Bacteroides sp.]|uniref:alpha-galactosidase n=1 Tax=uncultured Bacteroides sp. TaxID=162156 RepID=UPI0025904252|nr:alpha-galactosidase [uncultured Bacteroides sp.]
MKKYIYLFFLLSLCPLLARAADDNPIAKQLFNVTSGDLKLSFMVGTDGRLYQLAFGDVSKEVTVPVKMPSREWEFLPPYGNGVLTEPALQATHVDGNTSTELLYTNHKTEQLGDGITQTVISLKDPAYPFSVDIYIKCYESTSMMEIWNTITHNEKGKVILYRYASASPVLKAKNYRLTQFIGNYKREATLAEEELTTGIKVLDSKLGIRANQMRIPSFLLSLNGEADENKGEVLAGSLKWAGSFQLAFEVDWNNNLRVLTGINPVGSQYHLERGDTFITPAILYAYSKQGKGDISRKFHCWARAYGIRDAEKDRPVLLNNWEATHCTFDEERLKGLFDGARQIGAELFLLDDGWFGNGSYSRDDDKHGLGDWEVSTKKLPRGLSYIAKEALKRKVGFGIWLEPEMVNPQSELYNKHPEWIITQQKREPILGRHQEILDLTRPEVQQYEWEVIDKTLRPNPDISYVKWDCNRYVTQPGSTYLQPDKQSHLLIDYNWALYRLMDRFAKGFPDVMAMLCAGGSGRVDYGSMQYFHSFWPSDNTDPLGRIKIQWGFSHFFPASTISAHVTRMGKRHLKMAIDVALSGSFGIDLALDKATPEEREQLAAAVKLYKESIRPLVMQGDLYRLVSPYEQPVASLSYVSEDKERAVVYIYQTEDGNVPAILLNGLDANKRYRITEVNLPKGQGLPGRGSALRMAPSRFAAHGKLFTGAELMTTGIANPLSNQFESAVILLTVEN